MLMLVYLARNRLNGKGYVGVTTRTLEKRRQEHRYCAQADNERAFYRAIRKYTYEQIEWEVLAETDDTVQLLELERKFIAELRTFGSGGYNMTEGGEGMNGYRATKETRLKQRLAKLGKKDTDETRQKKSRYSKNRTPEHLKHLSESQVGKVIPYDQREQISQTLTGRRLTDEHKQNISVGLNDPEVRERNRIAHLRENLKPETLQRLSEVSSKPVVMLDKNGQLLKTFSSIEAAAREMGVSGSAISHVINGHTRTSCGYVWRQVVTSEQN
jgi:group I intron endonuclease